jgi:hypothetical protein
VIVVAVKPAFCPGLELNFGIRLAFLVTMFTRPPVLPPP